MQRFVMALAMLLTAVLWPGASAADGEYGDSYDYDTGARVIDIGGQPLGYPSALFTAAMARDLVLDAELRSQGIRLRSHAFFKGFDIVPHLDGTRLEAGLLGDMPTLLALARNRVIIVGLVKLTFTAVVTRSGLELGDLKGRRIGYALNSLAHYTLLKGLSAAGLGEADVRLVAMNVDEMPEALARGDIEAFAAWEPAVTVALAGGSSFRAVYRGLNTEYFVIARELYERRPDVVRALVASFVRAFNFMSRAPGNIEAVAAWALADGQVLTGKPGRATIAQIAQITRREILDVPSAPALPRADRHGRHPLFPVFEFLQSVGKIPADLAWERVSSSFAPELIGEVMSAPDRWELQRFSYR